jgi:hypothetical protein
LCQQYEESPDYGIVKTSNNKNVENQSRTVNITTCPRSRKKNQDIGMGNHKTGHFNSLHYHGHNHISVHSTMTHCTSPQGIPTLSFSTTCYTNSAFHSHCTSPHHAPCTVEHCKLIAQKPYTISKSLQKKSVQENLDDDI